MSTPIVWANSTFKVTLSLTTKKDKYGAEDIVAKHERSFAGTVLAGDCKRRVTTVTEEALDEFLRDLKGFIKINTPDNED